MLNNFQTARHITSWIYPWSRSFTTIKKHAYFKQILCFSNTVLVDLCEICSLWWKHGWWEVPVPKKELRCSWMWHAWLRVAEICWPDLFWNNWSWQRSASSRKRITWRNDLTLRLFKWSSHQLVCLADAWNPWHILESLLGDTRWR